MRKALVVDDSKTMCEMVKVSLTSLGFEATACLDGEEAVDIIAKDKFDLIVTDINMPNMDGIELIRYLRDEAGVTAPIIVLTTEGGDAAKSSGKSAGASGWMVKPFNPSVLKSAVSKLCP